MKQKEVEDLGWWEWTNRGGVVVVEWGDKFPKLIPPTALKLIIEFLSEESRRVIVEASHPDSIPRLQEMIKCWPL
jgi:tRNA threonylcarbamoyladenosine biosynthesis protein TsaE